MGTNEACGYAEEILSHTYVSCLVHCVFSTKGRRNMIAEDIQDRLWSYMGGIAREHGMKALAVGGTADHAHVLLSMSSTLSIAKAVQLIKGGSSKWLHDEIPVMRDFAWQEGYGAFSIGVSQLDDTVAYIRGQRERHGATTFEEEYTAFLTKHGIEFDRRYVFG